MADDFLAEFAQLHAFQGGVGVFGQYADYVAVRKKLDLQLPIAHDTGLVILGAALLGSTRLIDNLEV